MSIADTRFMKACRLELADTTPVWFMRQAGRMLPEYRKVRERYTLMEVCRLPELCAEVTMQPVRRLNVDAAVMFADIMLPLIGIGVGVELVDNVGPVVANPIKSMGDLATLRPIEPEEDVPFVLEAVRIAKREMGDKTPLIGFCGAPFTLASYLIEGKPTREFSRTKTMMYTAPDVWHSLMERLTSIMVRYLHAQVDAGVDYTHIRGGRKPSPKAVEHLRERYMLVGGKTPLLEITHQVASLLEERLKRDGGDFKVYAGMKHWHPYIGDVMDQMAADGVQRVVAFALAPHCSRISLGGYRKAVEEAQERLGNPFDIPYIKCWHHNEQWREMITNLVREGLQNFPEDERESVTVVFSAHSLPERIRTWGDPYEGQLLESSADIARRLELQDWRFAFQSAGSTGEPWLGPDIVPFLETLNGEGVKNVLSVPLGFVSDHLEILYDLDIEAKEKARELGMTYYRTAMPNTRPDFIEVLASVVEENLNAPVACSCYPEIAESAPLTLVANK